MTEELFRELKGWEAQAESLEAEAQKEAEQLLRSARVRSKELLDRVKAEAQAERERLLKEAQAGAELEAKRVEEEGARERERLKGRWAEKREQALGFVLQRMEGRSDVS